MCADENLAGVARVEGERPDAATRKRRVEPLPSHACVGRAEDAAALCLAEDSTAALVCVADEDLVRVLRVDEDAREASQRKSASATQPTLPAVVRDVERLRRADVNIFGPL